jgi:hypothetical protein
MVKWMASEFQFCSFNQAIPLVLANEPFALELVENSMDCAK